MTPNIEIVLPGGVRIHSDDCEVEVRERDIQLSMSLSVFAEAMVEFFVIMATTADKEKKKN